MSKNLRLIFGILLIIGSLLLSVFSYYFLVFSIPAFLLGVLFVWFSKLSKKAKLWLTILPLILYFPAAYLFYTFYPYSPEKWVYIPEGFEGSIRIVLDESCVASVPVKERKQEFNLPSNGVLILNDQVGSEAVNFKFFRRDKQGKREKMKMIGIFGSDKSNELGVYFLGSSQIDHHPGFSKQEHGKSIHTVDFFVNSAEQPYAAERKFDEQIKNNLIREVLSCRNHNR